MRVAVTGSNGQLGSDVIKMLKLAGHEVIGYDLVPGLESIELDITDQAKVIHAIASAKPDAIVHCAAWTDVDKAELTENSYNVRMLNDAGTRYICEAAKLVDAKLVYISTDYVFNGRGTKAWKPESEPDPLNYYGKTKLFGEQNVSRILDKFFIVRTSWVFGINGKNFVKTMIDAGKSHTSVRVVYDQIGTPTYTVDLAKLIVELIETDKYGYYHATNGGGFTSWYDFCREIYKQYGLNTTITPVSTIEYGFSLAKRPYNSRLDKSKLTECGFSMMPDWKDALSRYLKEARSVWGSK